MAAISLSHSTLVGILQCFEVSETWISFFKKFLEYCCDWPEGQVREMEKFTYRIGEEAACGVLIHL